ncbi:MAG TPA: DNA repair protein RecO [Candidatus Marinimicrobia bacterium]|nr:DNA repair protein RecO [Candidatus Neomarinimicrobiota bacterium]HRU92381.1 DNA repair protein RecO [Candidatus Neomarinimicrobiota bacterium]
MAIIRTRAFVIKTIPFKDTSLIVRLFTESHGKVAVLAKGARTLKNPFRGYLEPLNLLEVQFYYKPTRDIQTLSQAETIRSFLSNSTEIEPTIMVTAILECIEKFIRDRHEDVAVFKLVMDTLDYIEAHRDNSSIAFVYFILNLTTLMGYGIDFDSSTNFGQSILPISNNDLDYLKKIEKAEIHASLPNNENLPIMAIAKTLVNYLAIQTDLPVRLKSFELLSQITRSVDQKE